MSGVRGKAAALGVGFNPAMLMGGPPPRKKTLTQPESTDAPSAAVQGDVPETVKDTPPDPSAEARAGNLTHYNKPRMSVRRKRPSVLPSDAPVTPLVVEVMNDTDFSREAATERQEDAEHARIAEEKRIADEKAAEEAHAAEEKRLEAERLENERLEAERLENERLEAERLENERLEAERLENERLTQIKAEDDAHKTEEHKRTELKRIADENAAEEARVAEETHVAEEQRVAQEKALEAQREETERKDVAHKEAELQKETTPESATANKSGKATSRDKTVLLFEVDALLASDSEEEEPALIDNDDADQFISVHRPSQGSVSQGTTATSSRPAELLPQTASQAHSQTMPQGGSAQQTKKFTNALGRGPLTPLDKEWMKDAEALACFNCGSAFHLFLRRHHCRWCGKIFCYACSMSTFMNVRSCDSCYAVNEGI